MSLYRAAFKLLKPHVAAMRSYANAHPMPAPVKRRAWPTRTWVWSRYVSSMITAQTRSSTAFWDGLNGDPDWGSLRDGGAERCPPYPAVAALLRRRSVRFPRQKAERIRQAVDCDFCELATELRRTFAAVHDTRLNRERRRLAEVRLSTLLQEALRGCGVAPKIARLALMGAREITQVVPIDSRWQTALERGGYLLRPADLASEESYREIEDVLCEVAWDLGVRPTDADGVGFGWLEEGGF